MVQKKIYELQEEKWKVTRKDLTEKVFGKALIPEGLTNVKIVLTKVESGGKFNQHSDDYHHVFYFLEGEGIGFLGGERYKINPGLVVQVPAGEEHGYENTSDKDLQLITINIPIDNNK
ncbi:MAG: cupin domain-containing protein [Candidatus Heimdallarchaeota archaeon]|nr:cupin domain-containing protein [Candidatus Heimdallarchaeota archaeon]